MGRNRRFALFVVLAVPLTFVAVAFAAAKDSYTFDAKNGKVTFNHKVHAGKAGKGRCSTCHHEAKDGGQGARGCGECHKAEKVIEDGKGVSSWKDVAHRRCIGCHEDEKAKKPPVKCAECHKK